MISQKHRFSGHKSLDYVYQKGKGARTGALGIKAAPSRRDDYRLAVVVSKKVSKSAVRRNRIRRRIFELFRKARSEYGEPIRYDIVITAFDERIADMPAEELSDDCKKLIKTVGLMP